MYKWVFEYHSTLKSELLHDFYVWQENTFPNLTTVLQSKAT